MTDTKYTQQALRSSKNKYECKFDSSLSPLKRNLLFVSVLAFASLIVSPKNEEYTVNLGVISGVIEEPFFIFGGLFIVCAYHIYLFWIKCRDTILNSVNYNKVVDVYMYELASIHAFNEWHELTTAHTPPGTNMAVGSFSVSPKGQKEVGKWKVRATIESTHLQEQDRLVKALENNNKFDVGESRGFSEIDYTYEPSIEDYQYLRFHRDMFWLAKKKEFIEYVLPLLVGFLASVALLYRISSLVNNGS